MFSKLTPKVRRNIYRVIPFGVIFVLCSFFYLFIETAAQDYQGPRPVEAIDVNIPIFIFANIGIFIVGLLVGTIEMVLLPDVFRRESFIRKIIYKVIMYLVFMLMIITLMFPIAASLEAGTSILDPQVWDKFQKFMFSKTFLSTLVQLSFTLLLCLIYAEISENLGHSVLTNFFTGKYHQPVEEERIFMFLDMKSSTTFAEQLGHVQYFELLRSYYSDLSEAIIAHEGEVYQYIGDEIVITWPIDKGLRKAACVQCFFAMKKDLEARHSFYQKEFGVTPTFKAGIHLGEVTTGEIGALKKEIFFTGDVLNTTARIQSLCKKYNSDFLLSSELYEKLPSHDGFEYRSLGSASLTGKSQEIGIYSVALLSTL